MSQKTPIEWTDVSWNPTRGCSRVSPGCLHCYAERVAVRFSGEGLPYEGLARRDVHGEAQWTGKLRFVPETLPDPLRWRAPQRIFVNSMSDLFHDGVTDDEIAAVFGVMSLAPWHTFQVLTKRSKRMQGWVSKMLDRGAEAAVEHCVGAFAERSSYSITRAQTRHAHKALRARRLDPTTAYWPLPNVMLGVSVENQSTAASRILDLLLTPAALRMLSIEPLLERVYLRGYLLAHADAAACACGHGHGFTSCPTTGRVAERCHHGGCGCEGFVRGPSAGGIGWVIAGGESGGGARTCDVEWLRALRYDCMAAKVPFFMKQLGAAAMGERDGLAGRSLYAPAIAEGLVSVRRLRHRKGGDLAEWPLDLQVREFPRELGQ